MSTLIRYTFPQVDSEDYIDEFFKGDSLFDRSRGLVTTNWPLVDITENENSYMLKADLPGVGKEDISIKIEKSILSIEGEKKIEHKQEKDKFNHYERTYGKFNRSFALPEGSDTEKTEASLENGVLVLTIPKGQQAKPRIIKVNV